MKQFILLLSLTAVSISGFSQKVTLGAGLGIFRQSEPDYYHINSFAVTAAVRYPFIEKDNLSFSFDVPLSIGFSSTINPANQHSTGFMIDVPVIANFNLGAGTKNKSGKRMGYFAGAGFEYNNNSFHANTDSAKFYQQQVTGGGPTADAGIRYAVGKTLRQTVELRFSYMRKIVDWNISVSSLGCLYNF